MLLAYDILDPRHYRPPNPTGLFIKQHQKELLEHGLVTNASLAYSGLITKGSAKRLRKAINILISLSEWKTAKHFKSGVEFKFKINFITLTLPSPQGSTSDNDLKKYCLQPWLKYWRRKTKGMSYVWRAERQKNGNLHFHICTDRYIYYKNIRDTWNKALNKYDFINAYQQKHINISLSQYLQLYPPTAKNPLSKRTSSYNFGVFSNWRSPNSTDVHSINQIEDLAGYLVKYMAKLDPLEQKIEGRVWDASTNIKKASYCTTTISSDINNELHELSSNDSNRQFKADRCTGMFIKSTDFEKSLPPAISKTYQSYLKELRKIQP